MHTIAQGVLCGGRCNYFTVTPDVVVLCRTQLREARIDVLPASTAFVCPRCNDAPAWKTTVGTIVGVESITHAAPPAPGRPQCDTRLDDDVVAYRREKRRVRLAERLLDTGVISHDWHIRASTSRGRRMLAIWEMRSRDEF